MVSYLCSWHVCMVVSQVDDNWGTLDGILWFVMVTYVHDHWLSIYIYIHLCIYLYVHDTWWSLTVCLCMCVCLVHNHDTCCLNYSMFFCSDLPPPLQVSILAWKLIPRKWKETCWKTIPKLKSKKQLHCFTQNETIIFKNQTITIKEQRLI